VSDFSIMQINEEENQAYVEIVSADGGHVNIREGDFITIDGSTGNVFMGYHRTRKRNL
jgi:phosphohistidine swiveling domain-containing protein